jgi:Tfp pilus assembly protein FimV
MRDKLAQVNRVLEGITLDDFEQVKESAQTLRMISRATSWHIVDQTPQYKRLVKNFQEQATDLERHAEERNVEAATLDLVRMNITCTHCHQHMREEADRRK